MNFHDQVMAEAGSIRTQPISHSWAMETNIELWRCSAADGQCHSTVLPFIYE